MTSGVVLPVGHLPEGKPCAWHNPSGPADDERPTPAKPVRAASCFVDMAYVILYANPPWGLIEMWTFEMGSP